MNALLALQVGLFWRRMEVLEHEMLLLQAENHRLKQLINTPAGQRVVLTVRLSADEIRAVCQDIGADYENLQGDGHAAKIISLLDYVNRRGEMARLVAAVKRLRPDVDLG